MEKVMRFALVNDERSEAAPQLLGCCLGCSQPMIAKCGTQRVWHWAHRSNRNCDTWWEPETLWHRDWKNQFPSEWQEIIQRDEKGEKHVADVMTANGQVIEFQHSHLPAQERAAREAFYRNMIWIVDGMRLKNDRKRFLAGGSLFSAPFAKGLFLTRSPESCLPAVWLNCTKPVLFDFEGFAAPDGLPPEIQGKLWCLLPGRIDGQAVLAAVSRSWFIDAARMREQIIPMHAITWVVRRGLTARRWNYTRPPHSGPSRGRRRAKY
ncbi:competence protein [Mesorhizobium sp. M2D.F.Ca.ET.185.01.1.1]|nr:competence protein [Mesorhizobium sp. M2D.F.Ca.ET.140.01.1.1]TGP13637.1 competence protein [Mesorhizobium sp. M2D.F.Ca.ET.233.01.1.1]TGP28673.1 competence protein [Mesorhizobium sp. M2D.F.Ca.ET.232.01.1.1]TGP56539.1 competence protein [Mesorhizobium sp. M2D.F.Ca.ET.226.01.1.1]TGP65964.1 competence protein [Mesorhizobium sp. M2D.F.Ca.ET.225.01.1.1]TGP71379.1 competence protein [Mesorhizobium sp. M2D.F.Ca.ET.224.01.1.1]TGP77224.1 competence protein [bacterium M00.F.Ca.ET.227.01.1.1]TGP84581